MRTDSDTHSFPFLRAVARSRAWLDRTLTQASVWVVGTLRRLVEIWRGDIEWQQAIGSGSIEIRGSEQLRRQVPLWFPPSVFANVPRVSVAPEGVEPEPTAARG
jgi:hypothetical protein